MSVRSIIFDTETTGMNKLSKNKAEGHRVIELGCIELIDRIPTGNYYHCYFNPMQPVDPEAFNVHGLSDEFLADKPLFGDQLAEIEAYLDGADELIAHNIGFDQQFIDQELVLSGRNYQLSDRFTLIDSLKIAKEKFPGARNSLDALCKRFNIDNSNRDLHGALLDSELLAQAYLKLTGGQYEFMFRGSQNNTATATQITQPQVTFDWLKATISEGELAEHQAIMEKIKH